MRKANGNFSFTLILPVVGILLACFSLPVSGAIPPQERAALVALYNSTNGDYWIHSSDWKTPPLAGDGFALPGTENTWFGITCDPANTTVQSIDLEINNLNGSLPPELGNLANLQGLFLEWNQLSGSIPPGLGNLANLQVLYLEGNELSGSIPPGLGNLANLQELRLYANQLSGSIPPELGNLANLQVLYIGWNQLSGSIPPELGNLVNLQVLYIGWNQLSGSIPPELGNLVNLQELYLEGNQLSGSIPPELGNLANLQYLWLSSNRLSGSIPSNLTNLANLWEGCLDLKWNALYTNDDILRAFLDSKQSGGNWEGTQTIAPPDVSATSGSTTSIDIDWTPIPYTSETGGYRVFYSTTPGGPYTYFGITADKTASSLTVTGLNPGTTYYFVVQTRTDPHGDNQNTVDSEYSAEVSAILYPLILTSPNGGESWGLGTIRNITWTSSGLSGNIRLELWKAGKRVGDIAANMPIVNGNYPWTIGQYSPGSVPAGNDYRVKIITANGLYTDSSDGNFSIVNPSITLTSPQGGENWKLGTQQNITWTSLGLTGNVKLILSKGGVQVGTIAQGIPIANGTYTWKVGKHSNGMAPAGSDYTVRICTANNRFFKTGSNFRIW